MELIGQIIVFILGAWLTVASLLDIKWRLEIGRDESRHDVLIILIPSLMSGCYLLYQVFS